jgi:hypothetical protein
MNFNATDFVFTDKNFYNAYSILTFEVYYCNKLTKLIMTRARLFCFGGKKAFP